MKWGTLDLNLLAESLLLISFLNLILLLEEGGKTDVSIDLVLVEKVFIFFWIEDWVE